MKLSSEAWETLSVDDSHVYLADEQTLFSRSTVNATAKTTGTAVTYPLLQMITIRANRIARIEPFYWDTAAILQAFSKAET